MLWLSLDWDWVTGDCRDGYSEKVRTNDPTWGSADRHDELSDLLATTQFKRVHFHDEHHQILHHLSRNDTVWDIDDHWDDYPPAYPIACWNWITHAYNMGVRVDPIGRSDDGSPRELYEAKLPPGAGLCVVWSREYTSNQLDERLWLLLGNVADGCPETTYEDTLPVTACNKLAGLGYRAAKYPAANLVRHPLDDFVIHTEGVLHGVDA